MDATSALLMDILDNLIAYTRPYTGFSYLKLFQLVSFFLPDLVQCSTSFSDPMLIFDFAFCLALIMETIPTTPGLPLVGNTYDVDFVQQTGSLEGLAKTYGDWTVSRPHFCETP